MFNLEKAHYILDEMVMNGCIIETNKNNVLAPVQLVRRKSSNSDPSRATQLCQRHRPMFVPSSDTQLDKSP